MTFTVEGIQAKIAELRADADSLERALAYLSNGQPAKDATPGKTDAPRRKSTGAAAKSGSKKERALALLLDSEPMTTREIAEALGDPRSGNTATVLTSNEHLFKRTGDQLSPWTLTAEGITTARNLTAE